MILKKTGFLVLISLMAGLFLISSGTVFSQEFIDPDIPESWYEAPKTASETGVTEFDQSPMLDERVAEGELPPVEERLPDDPPVIEPLNEVGKYGGTVNVWGTQLDWVWTNAWFFQFISPGQPTPDGNKMVPHILKDWEFSDDAKEFTLHLREGLKWSDGEELTADDYIFWWEHEANDETIEPVPPEEWDPPLLDVTKEDEYTVTYHYGEPNPNAAKFGFQDDLQAVPAHFKEQFHPDFVGEDKVEDMAKEVELDTWDEFYERIGRYTSAQHPEYDHNAPILKPYVAVERTETYLLLERNPYFPFVDTEGNQLPYIDKVRLNLANEDEMAASKASTGEADFAGRYLKPKDIPLYKKNEQDENYSTLLWTLPKGADWGLQFNLSIEDEELSEIFNNVKFRRAVSLALNRERINNVMYYGEAVEMQATVPPVNEYYKQEYADSYVEYEPEKAEEMLDEIGLKDQNDDGNRELPNGDNLEISFIFHEDLPDQIMELIISHLSDVGLDIEPRPTSRELLEERRGANNFELGIWGLDNVTKIGFGDPMHTSKAFAPGEGSDVYSPWPAYVNWNATNGEEGIEPPDEIKELIDAGKTVANSTDKDEVDEAIEFLLEQQAENLWMIGTVGMVPGPIIVNDNLKNVAEKGIWDWSTRYPKPYFPMQFYFDE
ncbi:MAG: ABC transporter substrate-binding protein [Halanaerobiales bacterium]